MLKGDTLGALAETLEDPKKLLAFQGYLETQLSDENLTFWLEVSKFSKLTNLDEQRDVATQLYEKYISRDATHQLNIDDHVAREISKNLHDNITPHLFDAAQKFAFDLLVKGPFPRFLRTTNFAVILHTYKSDARRVPTELFTKIRQLIETGKGFRGG